MIAALVLTPICFTLQLVVGSSLFHSLGAVGGGGVTDAAASLRAVGAQLVRAACKVVADHYDYFGNHHPHEG